jgi:hypothetical protein
LHRVIIEDCYRARKVRGVPVHRSLRHSAQCGAPKVAERRIRRVKRVRRVTSVSRGRRLVGLVDFVSLEG